METCKTCKHWVVPKVATSNTEAIIAPDDPDTWTPMVMPFEVRACTHPALHFNERTTEENGFCITDGSGYTASLCTAQDFGCVRHEPMV